MPRKPRPPSKSLQSTFSKELERQVIESGQSFADVAKALDCPRSQISRYRLGSNRTVSPEQLANLVKAVSSNRHDQARLVAAHMEAHGYGLYADMIQVTVQGDPKRKTVRAKTDDEAAIEFLAERARGDAKVRTLILSLARALGATIA